MKAFIFAHRLAMVRSNQIETLTLWGLALLLALVVTSDLSHLAVASLGNTFLAARVAYVGVSLAGIPYLRTLTFGVGLIAWVYFAWILSRHLQLRKENDDRR